MADPPGARRLRGGAHPGLGGGGGGAPARTVRSAWNVYAQSQPLSGTNPAPFTTLTSYDLSR